MSVRTVRVLLIPRALTVTERTNVPVMEASPPLTISVKVNQRTVILSEQFSKSISDYEGFRFDVGCFGTCRFLVRDD